MPCNDSGFMDPATFRHWGVLCARPNPHAAREPAGRAGTGRGASSPGGGAARWTGPPREGEGPEGRAATNETRRGRRSWDWSNAKDIWINQQPMDSEDALIRQVEATQRANPGLRQLVYRNSVHAMPWYKTVLAKLQDERYSGFFLRFGATAPLPNGSYYSPPCDSTYSPVRPYPVHKPAARGRACPADESLA